MYRVLKRAWLRHRGQGPVGSLGVGLDPRLPLAIS